MPRPILSPKLILWRMLKRIVVSTMVLCLIACVPRTYNANMMNTSTLEGLKAMGGSKKSSERQATKESETKIRNMALRETALSVGAQSGLAARAKSIDAQLVKQTRNLDAIFDFNALILDNNVLPPVLVQADNSLNLASGYAIRISERTYKMVKQARFVSTPPNWRQYLWLDYQEPDPPHVSMLPNDKEEQQVWCFYVEKGWQKGTEQADIILSENIARIKEDFSGMILYRKLLAMNMVSAPYVSHTDLGVTGNGDELHIDDRVLRITALPALNTNTDEWRAAVAKNQTKLKDLKKMEDQINNAKLAVNQNNWQPVITPIN